MNVRSVVRWSMFAAAVGLGGLVVGLLVDAERAWYAYLAVWTFGVTICAGALILLMAGHASKGSWMVVIRRLTESVVDAIPLYILLFVPICFGLRYLYPWAAPQDSIDPAMRHAIEVKRVWLTQHFFIVRSFIYLFVFAVVGGYLRRWSKANDRTPRLQLVTNMRRLGGGALPLVALTLTWASFDWTMSLEPDWSSTIFGLYYFAGSFVGAIGLVCVMMHLSRLRDVPRTRITGDHAQALGRVLFAMIIFWAYMAFSQLLIYWIGNIPDEVSYYDLRMTGSWAQITGLLVCGMLVGPFFALLNRRWKRHTGYLAAIGAFLFLMPLHHADQQAAARGTQRADARLPGGNPRN